MNQVKRQELAKCAAIVCVILCGVSLISGAVVVSWMHWAIDAGILFVGAAVVCLIIAVTR